MLKKRKRKFTMHKGEITNEPTNVYVEEDAENRINNNNDSKRKI